MADEADAVGQAVADVEPRSATALAMFEESLAAGPHRPLLRYFDGVLSLREVAERADALAHRLVSGGFAAGDRLAICTQNNPGFVIGLIAAWKAGGVAVPINPMNTVRELTYQLVDTGARALLCLDSIYQDVARAVVGCGETEVEIVVVTSARDWQHRDDPHLPAGVPVSDADSLTALPHAQPLADPRLAPHDPALLVYTSGTDGVPKATINTHANVAAGAQIYRRWMDLSAEDVVLGITPVFHITGLIAHVALALRLGAPLVLAHRFSPAVMLEAIREHRPTFLLGTISALVSLIEVSATPDDFASLRRIASGGAPISPATAVRIESATGRPLTVVYGLTETTSPAIAVPVGEHPRVDEESGTLSIGIPVHHTSVRVLDEDGREVAAGGIGELAIRGPQVAAGYWGQPQPTWQAFPDGELRTGDIGFADAEGWFFLLDRKKDMITSAGYKVWPREVEEVLYRHPAVAEAAVVGVPDEVHGEAVTAFVALQSGSTTTVDGLLEFARTQLAAYKRPRRIVVVGALPKTASGKILRRVLRDDDPR